MLNGSERLHSVTITRLGEFAIILSKANSVRQGANAFSGEQYRVFFWKVVDSAKITENKRRTTFWLQGGPACSSLEGMFLEHGPFKVSEEGKIVVNEYS